ncbi:hypothetical protein [Chryseobacterium sp. Hurlbut01]|jgi:hypothetical protein|uniref:hypothetical protein n=1 Tax=Chryseobacterium sp. Hurlbut01 TaxID=1681828 RepID=UPI00067AAD23|nr:hypothetical protein [Chryseobacterium sp. Hurlbut01]KNB62968.1 hypothetical protein AC804_02805 [Chryseobacterium sp. Hurlbut01]
MKKTVILSLMVILTSSIFASNLDAQWNCSLDGYVGPDGTSCLYYNASTKCYYRVTHHRAFFGLFQWNTQEEAGCDKPSTGLSSSLE